MDEKEPMDTIMEKVDQVAIDMLQLLETQLRGLGITESDLIAALQFAIVKKMESKIQLPKE